MISSSARGPSSSPDNVVQGTAISVAGYPVRLLLLDRLDREHDRIHDRDQRRRGRHRRPQDQRSGRLAGRPGHCLDPHRRHLAGIFSMTARGSRPDRGAPVPQPGRGDRPQPADHPGRLERLGGRRHPDPGDRERPAQGLRDQGERICVEIVPNQNWNSLFDAFLTGLNTADVPIVTASNGILVNAVSMSFQGCNGQDRLVGGFGGTLVESFSFYVTQQSITGNGKLVISNIKYATVNDAVEGPVQVNVYGYGSSNTQDRLPVADLERAGSASSRRSRSLRTARSGSTRRPATRPRPRSTPPSASTSPGSSRAARPSPASV